jgi:hypothetical protein
MLTFSRRVKLCSQVGIRLSHFMRYASLCPKRVKAIIHEQVGLRGE